MLLSQESKQRINYYLLGRNYPGLILIGSKGIGKRLAADYIASTILSTDNLMSCPDYHVVESINGSILIDHLEDLKRKSLYHPATGKYKVFVIDDANTMNAYSQNSLLKLIEDGSATNVFIFVAHEPLLDTIHSRCETIRVGSPSEEEVKNYFNKNNMKLDETMMEIAEYRIGIYNQMLEDEKFIRDCKKIINNFLNMKDKRELLEMFGQVKEKDNENFFEAHANEKVVMFIKYFREMFVDLLYDVLGFPFVKEFSIKKLFSYEQCIDIISMLDEHISRMGIKGRYTKNDFFDLVRIVAS